MTKLINDRTISAKLTDTPREHRASHRGMAHFAGTGPNGMTCRQCLHWDHWKGERRKDGRLNPARCKKFQEIMRGQEGQRVPHDALACKYFEINPTEPREYER